ncbi:unnamed protein product [Ilex paraguariensis]
MHEESSARRKVDDEVHEGAVPAYLLDRETTTRAKVLSNTIKQKRKEKAGKWEVPLPKAYSPTPPRTMSDKPTSRSISQESSILSFSGRMALVSLDSNHLYRATAYDEDSGKTEFGWN